MFLDRDVRAICGWKISIFLFRGLRSYIMTNTVELWKDLAVSPLNQSRLGPKVLNNKYQT